MKTAIFNHARVRQVSAVLLLSGALTCIFPPGTPEFLWWGQHSVGVAIGYVGLGLFFLIFNNSRLMFVCLGCGAAISFHYHEMAAREYQHEISFRARSIPAVPVVPRPQPAVFPILPVQHEPAPSNQ